MASQFAMRMAAHHIQNSGVIIYPTETVYGLGCDPMDFNAISRINELKNREENSTFLLLASNIDQLASYIVTPDKDALNKINNTEVATSWITTAQKDTPPWLVSNDGSIGFRITKHPVAKQLCNLLNHPIISTSANFKGRPSVTNGLQCHQMFDDLVEYILTSSFKRDETPSTIRKLSDGTRIR